jgi:hypothetical protein
MITTSLGLPVAFTHAQLCGLPDTLQSWFLVQQLHIWMLLVRAKKEGSQGRIFYNHIVKFFWDDVDHKMLLMKIDDVTIKVCGVGGALPLAKPLLEPTSLSPHSQLRCTPTLCPSSCHTARESLHLALSTLSSRAVLQWIPALSPFFSRHAARCLATVATVARCSRLTCTQHLFAGSRTARGSSTTCSTGCSLRTTKGL